MKDVKNILLTIHVKVNNIIYWIKLMYDFIYEHLFFIGGNSFKDIHLILFRAFL